MARAYGCRPSETLELIGVLPAVVCQMLDAAAHELGGRRLSGLKGVPNIDLGTLG